MSELLHTVHHLQRAAQEWLATRNPATVDAAMLLAMTLEGMGIPGIPGEIPMLAQAGLIEAGERTYVHAATVGTVANFLGSLVGYYIGGRGARLVPECWRSKLSSGATQLAASPHSGWLILLSRSFGALRTPITWGAGAGHYPFGRYAVWALLGAILHVFAWQYALWQGAGWLGRLRPHELLAALAVAIVLGLAWWLLRRRAQTNRSAASSETQ